MKESLSSKYEDDRDNIQRELTEYLKEYNANLQMYNEAMMHGAPGPHGSVAGVPVDSRKNSASPIALSARSARKLPLEVQVIPGYIYPV